MRFTESFQGYFFLHFEWIVLLSGLLIMASLDPLAIETSLCLFDYLGVDFCPGEGFGRSIALLFRGQIIASFQMHPLGIAGTGIILHRIYSIFIRNRSLTNSI